MITRARIAHDKEPSMDYFTHNASKHADAAYRLHVNRAERARAALPFDGTLVMSKRDVWRARIRGAIAARCPQSIMPPRS
jgi:hypothetical protein